MRRINPKYKQSLLDISIQELGGIEGVFALALENGISATADIAGVELEIPKMRVSERVAMYYKRNKVELASAVGTESQYVIEYVAIEPSTPPIAQDTRWMISEHSQTVQDLTIQAAGSLDQIFEMALLNGISITENPQVGTKLSMLVETKKLDIVKYYRQKGIKPATGLKQIDTTTYAVSEYIVTNYWV